MATAQPTPIDPGVKRLRADELVDRDADMPQQRAQATPDHRYHD